MKRAQQSLKRKKKKNRFSPYPTKQTDNIEIEKGIEEDKAKEDQTIINTNLEENVELKEIEMKTDEPQKVTLGTIQKRHNSEKKLLREQINDIKLKRQKLNKRELSGKQQKRELTRQMKELVGDQEKRHQKEIEDFKTNSQAKQNNT